MLGAQETKVRKDVRVPELADLARLLETGVLFT